MSAKKTEETSFEDRPWEEGKVYGFVEDEADPDLVLILCYLHEGDPVAQTSVVYRVLSMDQCFEESVEDAKRWIRPLSIKRVFAAG